MTRITVMVDGVSYVDDVEPRTLLVHYLRDRLGKTGTVVGCDTSNCGACTVHLDGRSVKSCSVFAVQVDGSEIATIEGLARDGQLPMPAETALAQMADLAAWTAKHYPHVTAVRVGTAPYHHAGATAAQRAQARLRETQRNGARRRAPGALEAIAQRFELIPYGEAHARFGDGA